MDECDVVLPRSEVANFVRFTGELQRKYKVRIRSFGHAGDGNLHIYVLRDELPKEEWEHTLGAVFDELYRHAREFGGQVSGEHGIGFAKKGYLADSLQPEVLKLMAGIKELFDPEHLLNPGKVVS